MSESAFEGAEHIVAGAMRSAGENKAVRLPRTSMQQVNIKDNMYNRVTLQKWKISGREHNDGYR